MSMGAGASQGKAVKVIAVLVLLVLAAAATWYFNSGKPGSLQSASDEFYYDLATKELFRAPVGQTAPIESPSDKAKGVQGQPGGVRAFVFDCGGACGKTKFIAYLEKYTSDAQIAVRTPPGRPLPEGKTWEDMRIALQEGHLVADPEKPEAWVVANTVEGNAIRSAYLTRCPENKPAKQCN